MLKPNRILDQGNTFFCHISLRKRMERYADEKGVTLSEAMRSLVAIGLAYEGVNFSTLKRNEVSSQVDLILSGAK